MAKPKYVAAFDSGATSCHLGCPAVDRQAGFRETTVVWDRASGQPIMNAIVGKRLGRALGPS